MNRYTSIVLAALLSLCSLGAAAQDGAKGSKFSKAQIIDALSLPQDKVVTRGLTGGAAGSREEEKRSRALDLQVSFTRGSANLTRDGRDLLDLLGDALVDPKLEWVKKITLEGHTDAVGSASLNKKLSEKRALASRNYLVKNRGIAATKLEAVGKGKEELVDPDNPKSGVNRRVRVIVEG
jgi:outer membrane protein OmpA-like peptidoglycan-associated protein